MAAFSGRAMLALVVLLGVTSGAISTQYTVGGAGGWTLQQSNGVYDAQFASIKLVVGDTLLFPFTAPEHNVYQVAASAIGSCDFSTPIATYLQSNPIITLNTSGVNAFGCEVPEHCSNFGMSLTVTVSGSGSAPVTAPATAPVTPPVAPPTVAPPTVAPVTAPVTPPTAAPVTSPATPPTSAPVTPPATPPTPAPVTPPVPAPKAPAPKAASPAPTSVVPPTTTVSAPATGPAGPSTENSEAAPGPAMMFGAVFAGFAGLAALLL